MTDQINEVFKAVDSVITKIGSHLVSKLSTGNPPMLTDTATTLRKKIRNSMRHAVCKAVATNHHFTEQENEQFLRYNYFGPMFSVKMGAFGSSASISEEQRVDLTVTGSDSGYVRPDFYIKVGYLTWPSSCRKSTGIDTDLGVLTLLGEFKQARNELYIDEQKVVELTGLEGAKLALLCVPNDVTDFSDAEALRWHTVLADGEPALHYGESRLRLMRLDGNLAGCMVYREYDPRTVQLDVAAATPDGWIEVTPELFNGIIEHLTVLHGSIAPSSRSIEHITKEAQATNFEANRSAFISTSIARFVFAK
ncbi:hypothetical protein GQ42DRAFT_171560 [Ramicandelaber brevisporus]|nr:hypothetical protein GQ42DRAFT_171560 [Ramicandelaber brevisporus]